MNQKYTYYLRYACISGALAAALALGGCSLSGNEELQLRMRPQNRSSRCRRWTARSQTEPMRP